MEGKEFLHPDSVGADRRHSLRLLCLDRESGKILWERTAHEGTVYDNRHSKNTYASSTPATDGRHVYAFFGAEGLYCYDFNGTLVWKANLGNIGQMGMGAGTSPVLFDNLVIMQCDQELGEGSFVAAFDGDTGRKVWENPRKARMSWATPILVRSGSRMELVCSGAEAVVAYDPATGRELWRAKGVEGHAIPSAVAGEGVVFVSAGFPAKRTYAIRLGGSGDVSDTPAILWHYEKGSAYVPSPILYGSYFYLTTDKGLLTCLDARSGEVKYEGGRVPSPASFTASPVAFDGKIFLSSEDGDTFVVEAGPEHKIVGTNSLGEPIFASPALSRGELFIRGERNLYCIRKGSGS
jgi:outer membrane protein assembly factor BamB